MPVGPTIEPSDCIIEPAGTVERIDAGSCPRVVVVCRFFIEIIEPEAVTTQPARSALPASATATVIP